MYDVCIYIYYTCMYIVYKYSTSTLILGPWQRSSDKDMGIFKY